MASIERLALGLALRLGLTGHADDRRTRRDQDLGVHLLETATATHPAHRAGIQIVQANRQLQVTFGTRELVGHVEAVPGVVQPGFGPGVAGHVLGVPGEQIARHIARRDAEATSGRQENAWVWSWQTPAPLAKA